MRALLVFLASGFLPLAAQAQPLAEAPRADTLWVIVTEMPDLAYRLPEGELAMWIAPEADGEKSTAYRTGAVTVIGGLGSALGGTLTMGALLLVESSTGSLASGESQVPLGVYLALGVAGSTAGTALLVNAFGEDRDDYDGILPYPGIHPGDGWPALRGAAVGLLPGLAATGIAYAAGGDGAAFVTSLIAVPVFQGLGAAVSINLDRSR